MTPLRKLLTFALVSAPLFGACQAKEDAATPGTPGGQASADEYRYATPRAEAVTVVLPGSNGDGKGLTVESHSQALAVEGQTAEFYQITRFASTVFNGGAVAVLGLVKLIVSLPPTTLGANQAVWGPGSDALDPVLWRMTVTRMGDHVYAYALEGRDKNAPSAPFIAVLSGMHTPALDSAGHPVEGFGAGSFVLDFDGRNLLPMPPKNAKGENKDIGQARYTHYERLMGSGAVSIDASFVKVRDDQTGNLVDVGYSYRATPGNGGSMEFLHAAPAAMMDAGGLLKIKSRWLETGAGRSDVTGEGGTLQPGVQIKLSECWDMTFASRYRRIVDLPAFGWGVEASNCVFTSAEYSSL
jgi:hypothetical protein